MPVRRYAFHALAFALVLLVVGCRTNVTSQTPGDTPTQPAAVGAPAQVPAGTGAMPTAGGVPFEVRIDERVSPAVDCNPVRTQHMLVATVFDQCGNPLPGQRVEWILSRNPRAVGDIVASDDQYGPGAIAPLTNAFVGNNGNKIDNQYAVTFTNFAPELVDSGNNHPYLNPDGSRLPDITVGRGQSWITITSTHEGVTDIVCYVPGIQDGTKHKIWAKKVWADYEVEFPVDAVNVLPDDSHEYVVRITTTAGDGIGGQTVDAEILDGPEAVFRRSGGRSARVETRRDGTAQFVLENRTGQPGRNRIRFTAQPRFFDEICPRSRIVTKTWRKVELEVACAFLDDAVGTVDREITKVIAVRNAGDAPAEGVVIEDEPAAGLEIVGGGFPVEIGTLAPGETRRVEARFTSDREGRFENVVRVRDGSGATARTSCVVEFVQGRLEIMKVCEPGTVSVGDEVRFVVTVSNSGRGPLENVEVVDEYPAGITPTSKNVAVIPLIPPGERREVLFTGIAAEVGTFTNTSRASADGIPEEEASCSVRVVQCRLDMELVAPEQIYYGEEANFTLRIVNSGDGDAEGCTVRVTYGDCLGGGFQDFNIGPLAPGESWEQNFGKTASDIGPCMVRAESSCGTACEVRDEAEVRVTGLTALQTEMKDKAVDGSEEGIFVTGETFLYVLRVENDVGTEGTPPLEVVWELPPELEFVTGRCINGDVEIEGTGRNAKTAEFTLGVGGYLDFEIQVRVVSAPASGLVSSEARVFRATDDAELASETESTSLRR